MPAADSMSTSSALIAISAARRAPAFFKRQEEGGYSFVHTQPTTEDDVALCMEALEGCPVEAIGNDGDQ